MSGAAGSRGAREGAGASATRLPAGRVGRAHGLDGSFYVTRPVPRLLAAGAVLCVGAQRRRIVRRAGTDARPIVRLEGVEGRAAAEALRGAELSVERGEAPSLPEGEWWAHELEGCRVVAAGRAIGTVARMLELPSCEALEVELAAPGSPQTLVVPMVRDAIVTVDVAGAQIEVDPEFLGIAPGAGGE